MTDSLCRKRKLADSFIPCVKVNIFAVTKTNETRVEQVVEGDNLLVKCNANQTVDVDIFWTKNDINSTFRQNGTLLTFVKINRRSAGVYVCYSVIKTTGHKTDNNASVVETVDVDVQCKALLLSRKASKVNSTHRQSDHYGFVLFDFFLVVFF